MRSMLGNFVIVHPGGSRKACRCLLAVVALLVAEIGGAQPNASIDAQVDAHLQAAKRAEEARDYLAAASEYEAVLALRPDWALIWQSLGVTLHLAGRYEQAIKHLLEATRLDDQLWGAFLFLGMDYYQTHQFELALGALQRSSVLNPELVETQRWLGLSHAALGEYDEAVSRMLRVVGANGRDSEALFALARAYDNRASQLFEGIGLADPASPFVYLLQAERFAAEGEIERARAEYRRALGVRPDLAGTLDSIQQSPLHDQIDSQPTKSGPFDAIREAFANRRYRAVAERAGQVLAADRGSAEAQYWLGRAYKGLAAATLERLVEVDPGSHRVDQLEAEAHMGRTDFAKAAEAYARALKKMPELPGLRYALGRAYSNMGRFEEARRWFEDELDRNPHHARARHRLGSLLLDQGDGAAALAHLQKAVEAAPRSAEARFDLGRAYLENRDYGSAARELESYAQADPENDRVHFLLANAYRGLGRLEDAQRELRLYQDLSRERLRKVQEDVRSVSEDLDGNPQ